MGRRRRGTVYEKPEGSGVWYVALTLRSKKRYAQRIPARPDGAPATAHDRDAFRAELVRRYEAGEWDPEAPTPEAPTAPPSIPTVEAYAETWLAQQTHWSREGDASRLKLYLTGSSLGAMALDAVTPRDVAAWVRALRARPVTTGRGGGSLAPSTVRGTYHLLRRIYTTARFEGLVATSPCELPRGVLPPAGDKDPGARRAWRYDREEVELLISSPELLPSRRVLWAVLFLTGARFGEVAALRWSDWEPQVRPLGRLTISRAIHRRTGQEKGTKTGSIKEVPVHPTLAGILAEWRLSGWARHVGRAPEPGDYIIPTRHGTPRDGANGNHQLHADCEKLGLRPRRLHGARHTLISLAIDDGARADLVRQLTHPARADRGGFGGYRNEAWETWCAEVRKLRIARRAEVLPLWAASQSATDNATEPDPASLPSGNLALSVNAPSPPRAAGIPRAAAEMPGEQQQDGPASAGDVGANGSCRDDSATAVAEATPIEPLTGELAAQAWAERVLADDTEKGGAA